MAPSDKPDSQEQRKRPRAADNTIVKARNASRRLREKLKGGDMLKPCPILFCLVRPRHATNYIIAFPFHASTVPRNLSQTFGGGVKQMVWS